MQPRLDAKNVPNQIYKAMMGLEETVHASGLDRSLLDPASWIPAAMASTADFGDSQGGRRYHAIQSL